MTQKLTPIEDEYKKFLQANPALTKPERVAAFDRITDKWQLINDKRTTGQESPPVEDF